MTTRTKKICKFVSILFFVIGLSAFAFKGYTYLNRDKVVESSQIAATEQTKPSPAPQMIGAVGLFIGVIFMAAATNKD